MVALPVERTTPGKEVLGSIPAVAAYSLLVGSQYTIKGSTETEVIVSPLCVCVASRKIVRR